MPTAEPVLELDGLEVRYGVGRRPCARLSLTRRPRRDRRADRPERRRQVDDAPRDHGRRPGARRRDPARRTARSAGATPESIARAGVALVPGGTADLRRLHRRGEPPPRARRRGKRRGGDPLEQAIELFPILKEFRRRHGGHALGRPAAAAGDRPRARRRARGAAARRAVARPGAAGRGRRLRGAAPDPGARRHHPARRAARAAHRRARRPDARARRRRAAHDAHAGRRRRPGQDRRRLPRA